MAWNKTIRCAALLAIVVAACRNPAERKTQFVHPETYARLSDAQAQRVQALRAAADDRAADYEAQKQAGLLMMEYALAGVLPLQTEAEHYLERAYALRQDDEELLRTLGRFYNMRAVEHDFSKSSMQADVYGSLLGDQRPMKMSVEHFVAYSFFMLAKTIQAADEGKMIVAFRRLRGLEKALAERTAAQPDNVELRALAGNFALFFAGYVPVGQRRRVKTGIEHFEYVRTHWSQMRAGARDPVRCPNTYENFMFELAEAYAVLKDGEAAAALYRELSEPGEPVTRGKELVAAASQHRLENLDRYVGRTELMPPWPSDLGNCIVCHAYTGELPQNTFYVAKGLQVDLGATPSAAEFREVRVQRDTGARDDLLGRSCGPCHFEGGRSVHLLDLTDPDALEHSRDAMVEEIRSGSMPPDRELPEADAAALLRWLEAP